MINSPYKVNSDLNSVKQIRSKRRAVSWIPTQDTLCGKVVIGVVCLLVISGIFAAIFVPFFTATSVQLTETTTMTTTTATSTTATTTTTATTSTLTTTPTYPISCFATVTASGFYSGAGTSTQQADGLVDRPNTSGGTFFNSGGYPPQWVQLQLLGLYNISGVALLVNQSPNGQTRQQISVGPNVTSLQLVTDLTSYTSAGQWINITYSPILTNVEFVLLTTLSSPSWVAWSKFYVYND